MEKKRIFKKIAVLLVMALVITSLPNIQIWAKKTVKGVVSATELYMRSGPGTDYKNITVGEEKVVLVKDQEVTIVGERDGWYHIKATFMDTQVEGYSLAQWITVTSGSVKAET
ncbi:MAG: SH3 domain-containing protein, partial [Lachnospiraceae bacterium]|nr:SH3 domain-containing protein [Lachnospiraceae bacterium]